MSGWLCREPLKATNVVNFAQGRLSKAATSEPAREQLRVLTQKRAMLLAQLAQFQHDAKSTNDAFNEYMSLLLGFIKVAQNAPSWPSESDEEDSKDARKKTSPSSKVKIDKQSDNIALGSIIFKYSDNIANRVGTEADMHFEVRNMIMNFGLWHMKHASWLEDFSPPDAEREDVGKSIFDSLKTAAGVFKYLLDQHLEGLEYKPNTDFDERMLQARYEQCLAEAQEGILERARTLGHRDALIASIACDETRRYGLVADNTRTMEGNRAAKHLRLYFGFKEAFYKSYMWYFHGKHLLEQEEAGDSIRCLKDAQSELEKSIQLATAYAKEKSFMSSSTHGSVPPWQHPIVVTMTSLIRQLSGKAERENTIIHHKRVPPESLPMPEPREVIKMIEFSLPDASSTFDDIPFEWDRVPRLGEDALADKASHDDARIKPTPFDPVKKKGAADNVCVVS